jgi:signal transduction histidine kinase
VGMEGRLPKRVEVTGYYVVAEALTNVAKHASVSLAQVEIDTNDGLLRLAIHDGRRLFAGHPIRVGGGLRLAGGNRGLTV